MTLYWTLKWCDDVTGDRYLLQVSQNIDPTVEDAFPFSRVKLVDEICVVLLVTLLVPVKRRMKTSVYSVDLNNPCVSRLYSECWSVYLNTRPLWMSFFIFSVKCSTLVWKWNIRASWTRINICAAGFNMTSHIHVLLHLKHPSTSIIRFFRDSLL